MLASLLGLVACGGPSDPVEPDAGPDASLPAPDAGTGPDAAVPAPDGSVPVPDAAIDAAFEPDAAPDASAEPDAAPDAALPDAAVDAAALPDAAAPPPDASLPDAGTPLGGFVVTLAHREVAPREWSEWLVRIPLDGGEAINLTSPAARYVGDHDVTADGSVAVYQQDRTLFAVRTDGSAPPIALAGPFTSGLSFRLSPTGDRVAFYEAFEDGPLYTIRLDGTGLVDVSGGRGAEDPQWSPRGGVLVYEHQEGTVFAQLMLTCADRDCSRPILPGKRASALSFSPDGAYLAARTPIHTTTAELWAIDTSTLATHLLSDRFWILSDSQRWSHDGTRLAFLTGTTDANRLEVACADGTCAATLALPFVGSVRPGDTLEWSSDGRHVLAAAQTANGERLRLFSLCSDGSCVHEYAVAGDHGSTNGAFSPEGRIVHRGRMPGSSAIEIVADCLDETCSRVSLTQGADAFGDPPRWYPGTSRFAVATTAGVVIGEGIGSTARRVVPSGSQLDGVFFASGGQRVLFRDASFHLRSVRIDGSDLRDLTAAVPRAAYLSSYRLFVR